jgi:AcrR family transcriptional regulator
MSTTLRADAERNRSLVLEAARAVFAEHGLDAGVAEVAERAGVGVATIFRRFPTKNDLLAALLLERVEEVVQLARSAETLREFMTEATALHMQDRGYSDSVDCEMLERPEIERGREEARRLVGALVRRAQHAGEVREDVTVDDLTVIVLGLARAAPHDGWQRYLEFALDGLKPQPAPAGSW